MRKMCRWVIAVSLLGMPVVSFQAVACSYPSPRPFVDRLHEATTIFIFRLESAELQGDVLGGRSASAGVQGRIRVVETLKGDASSFHTISFRTSCGGVFLNVGHYFLIVTKQTGNNIALGLSDKSIIDVTGHYWESLPMENAKSQVLIPIFNYLDGQPIPDGYPPKSIREITTEVLPPPPPPPE